MLRELWRGDRNASKTPLGEKKEGVQEENKVTHPHLGEESWKHRRIINP